MTEKERLLKAIGREETDRTPCICPGGMMNMITRELMEETAVYLPEAHTDARKMARLALAVWQSGSFENMGVPFCMTVEAEALGAEIDLGSDIYEPHVTGYVIDSVAEWSSLPALRADTGRVPVVLEALRIVKASEVDVPLIGNLTGPVSTASSLLEPVTFYKELRKKKEAAHQYMEFITSQLIAYGNLQIAAGADVIAISDPSGTGEILGPRMFEEYAVTYLNKLLDGLQTDAVIVHICGQMKNVYDQVAKVKSAVLSFDSIVSIAEAREQLPQHALMGNVSTYAIEFGEPEKVKMLTRRCMGNGSDIVAPACGLGMKSPLENVRAMLACVKGEQDA